MDSYTYKRIQHISMLENMSTVSLMMMHRSESVPCCIVVLHQLEFQLDIYTVDAATGIYHAFTCIAMTNQRSHGNVFLSVDRPTVEITLSFSLK